MQLLDGKSCSEKIRQEIAKEVAEIKSKGDRAPHLAAVLVGNCLLYTSPSPRD